MEKVYRAGTRKSPLALKQAQEIIGALRKFYTSIAIEIVGIDTYGDKDKITPISDIEGSDFFTKEIDQVLLEGQIDFAVHSAKDLPDELPKGLVTAAITKSLDPFDALVSKSNLKIDELKKGAKIGASSQRRKGQLKKYRSDFQIVDIRGNIGERLSLLDEGQDLDAVIVAACALMRLGLKDRIAQRIPFEILTPHPLQGSLAVVVRKGDYKIKELLKPLANSLWLLAINYKPLAK